MKLIGYVSLFLAGLLNNLFFGVAGSIRFMGWLYDVASLVYQLVFSCLVNITLVCFTFGLEYKIITAESKRIEKHKDRWGQLGRGVINQSCQNQKAKEIAQR